MSVNDRKGDRRDRERKGGKQQIESNLQAKRNYNSSLPGVALAAN